MKRHFIYVPTEVLDPIALRRFLVFMYERLVLLATGIRFSFLPSFSISRSPTYSQTEAQQVADQVQALTEQVNKITDALKKAEIID